MISWNWHKIVPKNTHHSFCSTSGYSNKKIPYVHTQRGTYDLNGRSTEKWGGKRPVLKLRLDPIFGMIQLYLDLTHILLGLVWTLSSINYTVDASELRRKFTTLDVQKTL